MFGGGYGHFGEGLSPLKHPPICAYAFNAHIYAIYSKALWVICLVNRNYSKFKNINFIILRYLYTALLSLVKSILEFASVI